MRWFTERVWRYSYDLKRDHLDVLWADGQTVEFLRPAITMWLEENRISYRFLRHEGWKQNGPSAYYAVWRSLHFRHAKDAVLFKLRWC